MHTAEVDSVIETQHYYKIFYMTEEGIIQFKTINNAYQEKAKYYMIKLVFY